MHLHTLISSSKSSIVRRRSAACSLSSAGGKTSCAAGRMKTPGENGVNTSGKCVTCTDRHLGPIARFNSSANSLAHKRSAINKIAGAKHALKWPSTTTLCVCVLR